MKKYNLLTIGIMLLLGAWSHVLAKPITKQEALQKVQLFMAERGKQVTISNLRHAPSKPVAETSESYYVFNVGDNEGYVIISGDDMMPAVLGYSDKGHYDADNVPINMQEWLKGYEDQFKYLQENQNTKAVKRKTVTGSSINPLLESEWDQWAPYNGQCPIVYGEQSPTGCVATAMAQIMYYYKYPQQTRKSIHGYPIIDYGITVSDISQTTIDWDNILPKYDGNYSPTQGDAVAQLMQICGTSIRTKYGQGESGATLNRVIKSFPQYFGYSMDISLVHAADYELNEWNQLIYDELDASRPIIYSGSGGTGGHSFVVDGYDCNDYFHINWGWGGDSNGYFLLTVLPDYNNEQNAIIGIEPSTTNIPDAYGVLENGTMTLYYDTKMNTRSGQVFDNLICMKFDDYILPIEIEAICCPSEESMTKCVIDQSFATYDLETLYGFFYQCSNLKTITGLNNLNTSNVTIMTCMFTKCNSLENIDFNGFSTNNVQNMNGMFSDCSTLKNLDLTNFNTENVIDMTSMFLGCSSLENVDLSSFNVEKVETMLWMFAYCSSLETLDLSSFYPKNLLSMYSMFERCISLTEIDFRNFRTESLVDLAYAFDHCTSMESIDLSKFITNNVRQMSNMFEGCSALKNIDLSNFNTENLMFMNDMFWDCTSLESVNISSFDTSNVINMGELFLNCYSLKSLDLSNFKTDNVDNMMWMFGRCHSIEKLDLSNFNTQNVRNMRYLFDECVSLTSLNISSFNTNNLMDMYGMFNYSSLKVIDLSSFNTSNVTNMERMFFQCDQLETVYVGKEWSTENVEFSEMMFYGCGKLIGQKGTMLSGEHQDIDYAHVDGGPDDPGVFTLWSNTGTDPNSGDPTANTLSLSNITGYKGKQVVLPIALTNQHDITGFQFGLYLPAGVTVATKSNGKMMIEATGRMEGSYSISSNQIGDYVRIVGYSADGDAFTGNSGDILKVTLDIGENVTAGDYDIGIKDIVLSDVNNTEYHPADAEGTLTVKSYMLGDVDDSGAVNINDVVCIISHILKKPVATFIAEAADVDGSGTININDVVTLINRYILMKDNAPALIGTEDIPEAGMTDSYLYLADMEIAPGETREVQLLLMSANTVAGIQGNITLPAGLSFVTTGDGHVDVRNVDGRADGFTVSCALHPDGSLSFAQYSVSGNTYSGTGGVFTFKVKASEAAAAGTYPVALSDVVMSVEGVGYDIPERTSMLMVNGTTGVTAIDDGELTIDNYYTLDGVRHEGRPTQKGVYIVNGKTIIIK